MTDTQLLAVLAVAQLAYHAAYSLPGVCAVVTEQDASMGGLFRLVEHDAVAGPPAGVLLAGHLVMLLLAARLLGLTERLLWQSRSLLAVVRGLLLFLWPLLRGAHLTGPRTAMPQSTTPLLSVLLARLHGGRAPPGPGQSPVAHPRPTLIGGPCLP